MIFLICVILTFFFYGKGHKIPALFVFFFFVTACFNLIPEEWTEFLFISKGSDYALLILFGIIAIDTIEVKNYFKPDPLIKYVGLFWAFLLLLVLHSKIYVGLSWGEIIRVCRYQFFWLIYFVFRNMEKEQLEKLLRYLFNVTVVCAILFIVQIFTGDNILVTDSGGGRVNFFGMDFYRFYNYPSMLTFFVMMALYCNPYKGMWKTTTSVILVTALLGGFHRSWIGFFALAIFVNHVMQRPRLQQIRIFVTTAIIGLFVMVFMGYKFVHSRTYTDIQLVMAGNFSSIDLDALGDMSDLVEEQGTFFFRMGHLWERNQYLVENPKAMLLGAGLIPEDSPKANRFDFKIGLPDKDTGNTQQILTPDISYSMLFIWFGYIGTALNLLLFIYLMFFFYKNRDNRYGLFTFSYWILLLGTSFFSYTLILPITYILPLMSYCIIKKMKEE
ncbi:hypothetical protein AGMMS49982_08530 [Bacteroidia bacterium]|nr:hypothetical protein AGMMS49982_08530 [Bacteroidia bacterium]